MEPLFKNAHAVLILTNEQNYAATLKQVASQMSSLSVCCVTFAKPASAEQKSLEDAGLHNLCFIDGVGKCAGVKQCKTVKTLNDVSPLFADLAKEKVNAAIVPGIAKVLNEVATFEFVIFISSLAEKARLRNAKLAIVTPWDERAHPIVRETFTFMDKIVDMRA